MRGAPSSRPAVRCDPMTDEAEDAGDEWAGERVARWLRQSEGLERQLAPVTDVLVAAAALAPGEHVLDVGCGTGPTTRRASSAVGPEGSVTAVDVSADMVAAARSRATAAPVEWVVADAATWSGARRTFDAVISQFGVMFFDDPSVAFANLSRLTAPGGRLCVAVWPDRRRSELFELPLSVALDALERCGARPAEVPPPDEGPFSLGDESTVRELLSGAGWSDVSVTAHELPMAFGGGLDPRAAALAALDVGPTRLVTAGIGDAVRTEVVAALEDAFTTRVTDGVVVLAAEILVVRARRAGG